MYWRIRPGRANADQGDTMSYAHEWMRGGMWGWTSEMARVVSTSRLGSEFDAFLFALIGEDKNGLSLSVVSALARMDLDPWQEAAALAALPTDTATQKVVALFRTVPDESLSDPDRDSMATRLIALLPRPVRSEIRSGVASVNVVNLAHPRLVASALLLAICMLALLAFQLTMTQHDSPTPADTSHAAPSLPALPSLPQTSPATSDE
jgi:hypothetical protein